MPLPLPFVLASQNSDKAREIVEIFVTHTDRPLVAFSIEGLAFLVDAPDRIAGAVEALVVPGEPPDVEETGATLEGNARIKARALADALGLPAISDDTGLEVDALHGAPGVYSARYAGEHATYADNVDLLLRELEGVERERRTARFATVAMTCYPDGREISVRGEVEGIVTATVTGGSGFGYDPVFAPIEGDGRTFAEMTPAEKHAVSHRGRAFRALIAVLEEKG
jgi:XTP/dITP diphosphohydrolase